MHISPEHTALGGYLFCLGVCPMLSLMLIFVPSPLKTFNYIFAGLLTVLWLPLVAAAPQIILQLA